MVQGNNEVLHVVHSLNVHMGGPAVSVPRLADALTSAGMPATVLSVDDPAQGSQARVSHAQSESVPANFLAHYFCGLSPQLARLVSSRASQRCSILHSHGLWAAPGLFARRVANRFQVPLVVSPRGMLDEWAVSRSRRIKRLAWMLYEHRNLLSALALHATSFEEAAAIRRAGLRQPIAVIPNGVDAPELDCPLQRARTALFMSRLHPKKGVVDLLRAWAGLGPERQGWRLVLAGSGSAQYLKEVERHMAELGLQNEVHLSGHLDGDEKRRALLTASLFVLPSYSENFGMAIAEALAHGLPVITTTATPWKDVVARGCGWLVCPGEIPTRAALRSALTLPQERLRQMGLIGSRWMEQEFAWQQVGQRMAAVYRWLLGRGSPPADVLMD